MQKVLEMPTVKVSGELDGQQLWNALPAVIREQKRAAWCSATGKQNRARSYQLTSMLNTYLALTFPYKSDQDATSLRSVVSWSGKLDEGIVTFSVPESAQPKINLIQKIFKFKPER